VVGDLEGDVDPNGYQNKHYFHGKNQWLRFTIINDETISIYLLAHSSINIGRDN
jgi:hypothetical protein